MELSLIPDGHIPSQLVNYCASKDNTHPTDDAASIISIVTQCTTKLEDKRRDQILNLMYILGSPVLHLDSVDDDTYTNLLFCQKCNRQTTTLWDIPKDIKLPETISLRDEIIKDLVSKDSYLTIDPENKSIRDHLKSLYKSQRLFTCYHCAIPVITEIRKSEMKETENQILNDIKAITKNEPPVLGSPINWTKLTHGDPHMTL
jgi:hypothetical protein